MDYKITQCVQSVYEALMTHEDLDSVLSVIHDSALQITEATEGGVLVVAKNLSCLRIQVWTGMGVELKSRIIPMTPSASVCAWAVQNQEPQLVRDVLQDSRYLPQSNSNIRSELVVPVISRGRPLGAVNVESVVPGHFSSAHVQALTSFCNSISLYWELASLLNWQDREKEQSLVLRKTTAALVSGSEATLTAILDAALTLTHADIGGILVLSPNGNELNLKVAKNLRSEEEGRSLPRGTGIVWRAVDTGQMQNISDIESDADYLNLSEGRIKSLLVAPLINNGRVIGVINIESLELNHFSFEDADILKLFADQAAIAVSNTRLLDQIKAAQAIASLGSVSGHLAHRMNNIVGGVRVLAGLLSKDLEPLDATLADTARQIEMHAKDALNVVDEYEQLFSRPDESVEITQLIKQIMSKIKMPDQVKISFTATQPVIYLKTSKHQMGELIAELIRNSLKSLSGPGMVDISVSEEQDTIEISVSDNGHGIPTDRLNHIFDHGYTSRTNAPGKGFGLWWVHTYLRMLGGTITAMNKKSGGATVLVVIPKTDNLAAVA
jgi:GAF domain-containing protein/anti-sigma regulatory factor (Ser/Thr protein kinase)